MQYNIKDKRRYVLYKILFLWKIVKTAYIIKISIHLRW